MLKNLTITASAAALMIGSAFAADVTGKHEANQELQGSAETGMSIDKSEDMQMEQSSASAAEPVGKRQANKELRQMGQEDGDGPIESSALIRARDLIGTDVYTTGDFDTWQYDRDVSDYDAHDIGEVEDLVLTPTGQLFGVVAEVGGFLDIGDKHVMLPVRSLKVGMSGEDSVYVTSLSKDELRAMESVDEDFLSY